MSCSCVKSSMTTLYTEWNFFNVRPTIRTTTENPYFTPPSLPSYPDNPFLTTPRPPLFSTRRPPFVHGSTERPFFTTGRPAFPPVITPTPRNPFTTPPPAGRWEGWAQKLEY